MGSILQTTLNTRALPTGDFRYVRTGKCVRAAMPYVGRRFMHRKERSVPYIIVAGFRMVFIPVESAITCRAI
jgi:hypothetical protein